MDTLIGTSGYSYPAWKGRFYPKKMPAKQLLPFYASHFSTVEINNTFYSMPTPELVQSWADAVPATFRFAIKAPQRITHHLRLKNAGESLRAQPRRLRYDRRVKLHFRLQLLRATIVSLLLSTSLYARAQSTPATVNTSQNDDNTTQARAVMAAMRRALVVVTDGWNATTGTLRRFERATPNVPWRPVGEIVPVAVGKAGLGWGAGLVPRPRDSDGPDKREGDSRAPAGLFTLGDITGYDAAPPPGLQLAYRAATPSLRCVDDGAAPQYYNRLIDAPDTAAPWNSAEKMRRDDGLYRFTVFVRHNAERVPGRGSCVFLHVWRRPNAPTVGCTAMALPSLRALLPWLDNHTVLVQLPRSAYTQLQRDWDLPPVVK